MTSRGEVLRKLTRKKAMADKTLCVNCNLLYDPDELRCHECRAPVFIVEREDSDAIATDSDDIPW
ncbi:uncharacterized protein with PIN domain [Ralstonia sp. 121560039-2]